MKTEVVKKKVVKKKKARTNPNGANQYKLDPRQSLYLEYYFDPESETFSNSLQSALRAGFEETYALNLTNTMPLWLSEKIEEMSMVSKAERNLNEILDMRTKIPNTDLHMEKLLKIKADVSKFVAERLAKKKYGTGPLAVVNNNTLVVSEDQMKRIADDYATRKSE